MRIPAAMGVMTTAPYQPGLGLGRGRGGGWYLRLFDLDLGNSAVSPEHFQLSRRFGNSGELYK